MPGTGGVPGDAVTLRAENVRLRMLLEDKDEQIAALKTQNAELTEQVARLERLISRNSGTRRCRRTLMTGRDRRRGPRRPAAGAALTWPARLTWGCGTSHQVTDLAEAQAHTSWYDRHEVQ